MCPSRSRTQVSLATGAASGRSSGAQRPRFATVGGRRPQADGQEIDIRPNADSNIGQLPHRAAGLKRARVSQVTVAAASSRAQHFATPKAPHLQSVTCVVGWGARHRGSYGEPRLRNLEIAMSIIDKALNANKTYAEKYDRKLGERPTPKIAVVTCMDPRLSDLPEILGLPG